MKRRKRKIRSNLSTTCACRFAADLLLPPVNQCAVRHHSAVHFNTLRRHGSELDPREQEQSCQDQRCT